MALFIQELTIDNVSWTPYTPPDDASVIAASNKDLTSDLKFRTNSSDPTTEITISAGAEKVWGDYSTSAGTAPRFSRAAVFGFFQSVTGTGPVKIESGR